MLILVSLFRNRDSKVLILVSLFRNKSLKNLIPVRLFRNKARKTWFLFHCFETESEKSRFLFHVSKQETKKWNNRFETVDSLPISVSKFQVTSSQIFPEQTGLVLTFLYCWWVKFPLLSKLVDLRIYQGYQKLAKDQFQFWLNPGRFTKKRSKIVRKPRKPFRIIESEKFSHFQKFF